MVPFGFIVEGNHLTTAPTQGPAMAIAKVVSCARRKAGAGVWMLKSSNRPPRTSGDMS
jgi:hypothetical protein